MCRPIDPDDYNEDYFEATGLRRLILAELARDDYGFLMPTRERKRILPWHPSMGVSQAEYVKQMVSVHSLLLAALTAAACGSTIPQ
jgi:hypothetical protein